MLASVASPLYGADTMRAQSWFLPLFLVLNQCGGKAAETLPAQPPRRPAPAKAASKPGLPALTVAEVPPGTQGPVIAHLEDRSLAVLARGSGQAWQFQSIELHPRAQQVKKPVDLGPAPAHIELLFLKPLPPQGAILAYTHLEEDGSHHVSVQLLDQTGHSLVGALELSKSSESIQWLDVVPTASGPLVFWATRRGDRADMRFAALGLDGSLRITARDVASDLRAWQVAPHAGGAAIAAVGAADKGTVGPLSITFLDDNGASIGKPLAIGSGSTAELDVDIASIGDNCVVAYTDSASGDARLFAAAANAKAGVVTPAYPVTAPLGDQGLVKLVAPRGKGRAYIVWENVQAPTADHRLQVAAIDAHAKLGAERLSVAYPSLNQRVPEVISTDSGLALLTQIPAGTLKAMVPSVPVEVPDDDGEATLVPVFAAFSDKLAVTGVQPLITASRPSVPSLAWGLDCQQSQCFSLSALSNGSQVAILGIQLPITAKASRALQSSENLPPDPKLLAFDAQLQRWLTDDPISTQRPKLTAVRVVTSSEPLADLAVSRGSDVPWVATLTATDDASDAAADHGETPEIAKPRVDLRGPLGQANSASVNGKHLPDATAGLAFATQPEDKNTILVFASLEHDTPQVYVSKYDKAGRRRLLKQITERKGSINGLSAVGVPSGYFVAWTDEQTQGTTVQLARLTSSLDRQGPYLTIAGGESVKTGLQLLAHNSEVWSVWSDSRGSKDKRADIYLARLSQGDGRAAAPEQRLFQTPAHSHSPQLSACQGGVVVGFLEMEPHESQQEGIASVRIARIDDKGHPGKLRTVTVSAGAPTGFGVDCSASECHLAVTVDLGGIGQVEIASFDPRGDAQIHTVPLVRSLGPADQSISPSVVGNDVYWVDRTTETRVRVMRAAAEW